MNGVASLRDLENGERGEPLDEFLSNFEKERKQDRGEWLLRSGDRDLPKNPPGYLVSSIREQYAMPSTTKPLAPFRRREHAETPDSIKTLIDDGDELAFDEFVAGLTEEKGVSFERIAFQSARRLGLTMYERAVDAGSQDRIEGCRRAIILSFLKAIRKRNPSCAEKNLRSSVKCARGCGS